jgi:hypothetical protein
MALSFTCADSNTLNGRLLNTDPKNVHYQIKTTGGEGKHGRQLTEVKPVMNNFHDAPYGSINWTNPGIKVGDFERSISEIRSNPDDLTSG